MDKKPTIHVIDDDSAVRDSLSILLEAEGFVARTWASCAGFLGNAQIDGNCCLLVDMHMPGMGGLALLDHLRQVGMTIPAIVMTGLLSRHTRQAVDRLGAALLEKPFHLNEVVRAIETVFHRKED